MHVPNSQGEGAPVLYHSLHDRRGLSDKSYIVCLIDPWFWLPEAENFKVKTPQVCSGERRGMVVMEMVCMHWLWRNQLYFDFSHFVFCLKFWLQTCIFSLRLSVYNHVIVLLISELFFFTFVHLIHHLPVLHVI